MASFSDWVVMSGWCSWMDTWEDLNRTTNVWRKIVDKCCVICAVLDGTVAANLVSLGSVHLHSQKSGVTLQSGYNEWYVGTGIVPRAPAVLQHRHEATGFLTDKRREGPISTSNINLALLRSTVTTIKLCLWLLKSQRCYCLCDFVNKMSL